MRRRLLAFPLVLLGLFAWGGAPTKLQGAAEKCDVALVQAQLDQGGSATSGVIPAFKSALAADAGTARATACCAVLDALFARSARPDQTLKYGSLLQQALEEGRNDIGDALTRGHAMDCEGAAHKSTENDVEPRAFAIDVVLPRCGDVGATALLNLIVNSDDDLKRKAVTALGMMGPKAAAAAPGLTQLMNSGMSELALCAAESLARIQQPPPPQVEAHLAKRLVSGNDELINRALLALSTGGLGKAVNPNALLKLAGQTSDAERSNAAMEILIANGDTYAKTFPAVEKGCKGVALDCRTEPCQIAGDFDGNGKLDVARLYNVPGKDEAGVAFQLDSKKCVKWPGGAEAFSSWRLELAHDGKGTVLAISGGKSEGSLSVRNGQPRLDAAGATP